MLLLGRGNLLASEKKPSHKAMAAILAGGFGKRLRPITYKVPKPLVKIGKRPFLGHLLEKLSKIGIKQAVLLTGYRHKDIKKYCGTGKKWGMRISYSRESKPLGTGGALAMARQKIRKTCLVLNGDTYIDLDLEKFLKFHKRKKALATIFAMKGSLIGKGQIKLGKSMRVKQFLEKQGKGTGLFNTGAYLIEPRAINILCRQIEKGRLGKSFSMEREGFHLLIGKKGLYVYKGKGKFLDIGTFESLAKAGSLFSV